MVRNQLGMYALLVLAVTASSIGCQAIGRPPLGYRSRSTSTPLEVAANQDTAATNRTNAATATDDSSQRLAMESRALSKQYAAPQDPELAKFANSPGADAAISASSSARSGVRTSNANSSGSGCTNGCCR